MDFISFSTARVENKFNSSNQNAPVLSTYEYKNTQRERNSKEVFNALLSSVEEGNDDLTDNILEAQVSFSELCSLTDEDLERLGCKEAAKRTNLLQYFKQLPRQYQTLTEYMESEAAQTVNETILERIIPHMNAMRSALAAPDYKFRVKPCEDVVIGDRRYSSEYLIRTLGEMKTVAEEIDAKINQAQKKRKNRQRNSDENSKSRFVLYIALGASISFWAWKIFRNIN